MATLALLMIVAAAMAAPAIAQTPGALSQESELATLSEVGPHEGLLPEPHLFRRSIEFASQVVTNIDRGEVKSGFYSELSNMVTGAGWLSAGPGYRHWFFGDRVIVDGSAAISWRSYKTAQARFELTNLVHSRLALGSQVRWQDLTQVTYFGEGAAALESNRSEYRMESTSVVGYSVVRPLRQLAIEGRVGWLGRPELSAPGGTFRRGNMATRDVLPDDPVFTTLRQPSYAYQELLLSLDTRDHRSYPTRGGVYRTGWTRYSDQDEGPFSFRRFEAEAAHFLPMARWHLVLATHGWLVASGANEREIIPFYLLPSLGGHNSLRAYSDFRFHDRNLVVVNAEARVALFTHLDAAAFLDAGNVAPSVGELNFEKTALGIGLRLHTQRATFARFDIAHGQEGWRFFFRTSDPLQLSRLLRRTAAAPFAP